MSARKKIPIGGVTIREGLDLTSQQWVETRKMPIDAGMEFTYTKGGIKNAKIKEVGYYIVEIYMNSDNLVTGQKQIERVFY